MTKMELAQKWDDKVNELQSLLDEFQDTEFLSPDYGRIAFMWLNDAPINPFVTDEDE